MGSIKEFGRKMNLPMPFKADYVPRSPTLEEGPKDLSQQNNDDLGE